MGAIGHTAKFVRTQRAKHAKSVPLMLLSGHICSAQVIACWVGLLRTLVNMYAIKLHTSNCRHQTAHITLCMHGEAPCLCICTPPLITSHLLCRFFLVQLALVPEVCVSTHMMTIESKGMQ